MLYRLARRLTNNLVIKEIISKDAFDVYVYGFELFLSFLFSTAVILLVGCLLKAVLPTLAFLVVFILLRSFTGGYHARTYAMCSLVTFSVFGFVLLLSRYVSVSFIAYLVLAVVGWVLLFLLAPVEHPNKELTAAEKRKHKIIGMLLFTLFITAGISMREISMPVSSAIYFSLVVDLVLLFFKIPKERSNKQ